MNFIEYTFQLKNPETYRDILIAFFDEVGFETFVETEQGLQAYISENKDVSQIDSILQNEIFADQAISYSTQFIENKNWNEEWEKDFQPIEIEDKIYIRAEFHPKKNTEFDIVIQPKMSFGTGHHATTYLMLNQMYDLDFTGKSVMDMGCGTSILAIFAKMKGAAYTEGIDIDEWAYENSIENAKRNQVDITVKQGDVTLLDRKYDIFLANINKNILLNDIPLYLQHMSEHSTLLLSGIMDKDEHDLVAFCTQNGLIFDKKQEKNQWITLLFHR